MLTYLDTRYAVIDEVVGKATRPCMVNHLDTTGHFYI